MILTAVMHSSVATIIIGIAFVTSDVLSLSAVLPLVLGANIGTTLPVVISSLASRAEGKKLALFYFSIKVIGVRSEEHTSELQSRGHLVCRLLLEKKHKIYSTT